VSYRSGGESVTAVLSGAVQFTFENITILLPLIREGKVHALGVTSRSRSPLAPDLPTVSEAGVPGYEVTTFFELVAPAGTPAAVVNRLNAAMNDGLKAPSLQGKREFSDPRSLLPSFRSMETSIFVTDLAQRFSLSVVGPSHPGVVPLRVARAGRRGFFDPRSFFLKPTCPT
jgi:hypothetical protein